MLLNLPKKNISFCVTSRSFFNTLRVWGVNTPAKCPGTPKNLSLPHLCISQKNEVITTPTSHLQITISAFLFVWLPTWGSEWGEDRIWVWRGRLKGAGQQDMFVPIWCYIRHTSTSKDSMAGDSTPCRPTLSLPVLWVHALVIKISGGSNLIFLKLWLQNFCFCFESMKCYMCILLTCDWWEDNRFRMSSSLLLKCIVCNSKLVYVVWTLKSMQKSL